MKKNFSHLANSSQMPARKSLAHPFALPQKAGTLQGRSTDWWRAAVMLTAESFLWHGAAYVMQARAHTFAARMRP